MSGILSSNKRWEELKKWLELNIKLPLRYPSCMGNGPRIDPWQYKRVLDKMEELEKQKNE